MEQMALWSKPQCWIRFMHLGSMGNINGVLMDVWWILARFFMDFSWIVGWSGHGGLKTVLHRWPVELELTCQVAWLHGKLLVADRCALRQVQRRSVPRLRLSTFSSIKLEPTWANRFWCSNIFKPSFLILVNLSKMFSPALKWNGRPRDWSGHCWIPLRNGLMQSSHLHQPFVVHESHPKLWTCWNWTPDMKNHKNHQKPYKKKTKNLVHLSYLQKTFETCSLDAGGFRWPRPQPAGCRVLGERDAPTSAMGLQDLDATRYAGRHGGNLGKIIWHF